MLVLFDDGGVSFVLSLQGFILQLELPVTFEVQQAFPQSSSPRQTKFFFVNDTTRSGMQPTTTFFMLPALLSQWGIL